MCSITSLIQTPSNISSLKGRGFSRSQIRPVYPAARYFRTADKEISAPMTSQPISLSSALTKPDPQPRSRMQPLSKASCNNCTSLALNGWSRSEPRSYFASENSTLPALLRMLLPHVHCSGAGESGQPLGYPIVADLIVQRLPVSEIMSSEQKRP